MFWKLWACLLLLTTLLLFTSADWHHFCNYPWSYVSPVEYIMYRPPTVQYTDQLVNVWVTKSWRQDGKRIPCMLHRFDSTHSTDHTEDFMEEYNTKLVIYSHGNAENILTCVPILHQLSRGLQCDVLTYDYSGYGLNEFDPYERTADGMNATLDGVLRHAIRNLGYLPSQIYLMGYSLGSGVSTAVASRFNAKKPESSLGGLILVSAFASLRQLVKDHVSAHITPYVEERWNNVIAIRDVSCPVLIVHGEADGLVPMDHAKQLKRNASVASKAQWVILDDVGHTNLPWKEIGTSIQSWW